MSELSQTTKSCTEFNKRQSDCALYTQGDCNPYSFMEFKIISAHKNCH